MCKIVVRVLKPTHEVTNSDKMHFRKDVIEREEREVRRGRKKITFLTDA